MRPSRSRTARDVDLVDVLMVDDDEDVAADEVRTVLHELALEAMARRATWAADLPSVPDPPPAVVDPPPAGPLRRLARRYRRRALTGAVLVLAVATTTAVVDARQSAARAADLAAMPAVLHEVSSRPTEVWRRPGRVVSEQHDVLLVVDAGTLRGVDPATGAVTWTASAAAGRAAATGGCFPVDEGLRRDRAPDEDATGPRGLVACAEDAPGTSGDRATRGTRVVVLDSTTGRTRHTVTTDGPLLLAEPVGRDLLVVDAHGDRAVRVTRWDLAAGTPRWSSVSPGPVLASRTAEAVEAVEAVERRPDSLTVGSFAVDLATGEALDAEWETAQPHPYVEHLLPGGVRATWGWRDGGTSGRGRVWGGSARSSYFLPGPPLWPPVTDGSGGVLLVRTTDGDRLRGLDLRTGRMRWTRPFPGASPVRATAVVDGVVLLDDGSTVVAADLATGDAVWRAWVGTDVTDGLALTDGEVVLLPHRAADGELELVACRFDDGTALWRTAVPGGTVGLTVVDHHLIAVTEDEVVGLG